MDLRHLQAFLGQANLSTVAVYTQVGSKALKDLHQAMHPAASVPGKCGATGDGEHEALPVEDLVEALDAEGEEE